MHLLLCGCSLTNTIDYDVKSTVLSKVAYEDAEKSTSTAFWSLVFRSAPTMKHVYTVLV